jgi:hypothetical protein
MPDAPTPTPTEIRRDAEAKQRAMRCLWQLDGVADKPRQAYLYAILDTARDERIYPRLRRFAATEQVVGLYQGRAATEMAAVAPYLVCLGSTDRVFDWLWEEGWGESWGIFLWSLVSLEALRAHFRRLTMVRTEDGSRLLFRFYDPRVLRQFLPHCDTHQLREVFGPVIKYLAETPGGGAISSFGGPQKLAVATTGLLVREAAAPSDRRA